jgi:predicted amidohydrolase YtcJ
MLGRAAPPVVLLGGHVFTADRRRPWAEAVAFDGSGILAVGTTEEVRRRAPTTEAIDVGGRTIVPGFVDAHNHFLATGESLSSIDVRYPNVASCEDLTRVIREAAQSTPAGTWIHASVRPRQSTTEPDAPGPGSSNDAASGLRLSRLRPPRVVNSAAMQARGSNETTPDPPGGELVRDREGRLTGLCLMPR